MNSSALESRIRKSQVLQRIYLQSADIEQLAQRITLLVLSRRATKDEVALYSQYMAQNNLPLMEAAIDIMWMQINSNEFLYNH